MFPRNPGHLQTFDYVGLYRYFLTFCTDFRRRLFTDAGAVDVVLSQILRAAREAILGLLLFEALRRKLWQRYGYERVLRNDEATLAVARYIFENPIRAGLVSRVEDYPLLGSTTYAVADILEAAGNRSG